MPAQNLPGLILDYGHPLTRGLVAWYPLNEGAGRRASDISGNGNHGTQIADPTWAGAGGRLAGHALTLNGSSQYISVPTSTSLAILGDMTMACWLRIASYNWHMLFTKTNSGTPGPYSAYVNAVRGTIEFHRGNGTLDAYVESTNPGPVNLWQFVAVTMAGTSVQHYLNGAANGSGTISTTIGDSGNAMRLGNRADGFWLAGQMANWRLYNRALDAREVEQLYIDPMAGALVPSRLTRLYTVPVASPPAAATGPLSSDRLYNRSLARIFRRGETG